LTAVGRANQELFKLGADRTQADGPRRIEVTFAGAGDELEELRVAISNAHLGDCAFLVGRIPHQDVPAFVARQDIVCVPTREVEPFGIVAVEAAAAGVACLATRIGGLAETVVDGETGHLIEPGDVAALSAHLVRLARDRAACAQLGAAARERALAVYDWPRITDRFEALFDAVASVRAV
jgi:glycosyltransferase involved in cell wall biosynthesis